VGVIISPCVEKLSYMELSFDIAFSSEREVGGF
jgi:hypothetical protein